MESTNTADGRGKIARLLLAVALVVISIRSFRSQKRLTGVFAGVGALILGYTAVAGPDKPTDERETETVVETGTARNVDVIDEKRTMRCAACEEPIIVGQGRGPNENDEIVHDTCMRLSTQPTR